MKDVHRPVDVFRVDSQRVQMQQQGAVNSRIPRGDMLHAMLGLSSLGAPHRGAVEAAERSAASADIEMATDQETLRGVVRTMRPALNGMRNRLGATLILLSGKRGVGKRNLVQHAADELGVHLVRMMS